MLGVTASRNYKPGDLIYSEEPFAKVLPRHLRNIACESCCKRSFSLKDCTQCRAVKYCGKACQKSDWTYHKVECLNLKNLPVHLLEGTTMNDFCRLVAQIILKVKDEDWKNIKKRVMGVDFSFDDLESDKEIMESHKMKLFYKESKEILTIFIGKKNMPGDAELMKIIGKVIDNAIVRESYHFYIGLSKFKMECIPNAEICIVEKGSRIWAIKKINRGTDTITVPSKTIFKVVKKETQFLTLIQCGKCSDCSLPYGESVLTKILDDKKAYSVIRQTEIFLDKVSAMLDTRIRDPFNIIELREIGTKILRKQEGVLGSSNILRLKLLAVLCMEMGGHPLTIMQPLKELESSMREVFGPHYSDMALVYEALANLCLHLGDPRGAASYIARSQAIFSKVSPD